MTAASPLQDASEPAGHMNDRLLFWVTQGLFFGIATTGLFILKAAVLDRLIGPELASRTILVRLAILVIDVILLAAIYRQPIFRRIGGTVRFVAATAAVCLVVAGIDGVLSTLVATTFLPGSLPVLERHPLLATIHRIMLCVARSTTDHALKARSASRQAARRATAAELALRHSELERLGQQIEPHFLFNALNAVLAYRHDPEAVEALDNDSRVHRLGGPPLTVRRSLADWEEALAPQSALRVDRSLIIALDRIDAIHWRWQGGTQLTFVGSEATLTLGRAATRRLNERLDGER